METFFIISLAAILAGLVFHFYMVPEKDIMNRVDIPNSYLIETENRFDIQTKFECAAFSSAYLLRHFGTEADGNALYKTFPNKLPDGNIAPKGIIAFFRKRNIKASFHRGNTLTLKQHIGEGIPVIVFIKVFPGKRYLHFVPVVGYDEEFFYFAESLPFLVNSNEKNYNRKMRIAEFDAIWKTWIPFYKNAYIVVHKSFG